MNAATPPSRKVAKPRAKTSRRAGLAKPAKGAPKEQAEVTETEALPVAVEETPVEVPQAPEAEVETPAEVPAEPTEAVPPPTEETPAAPEEAPAPEAEAQAETPEEVATAEETSTEAEGEAPAEEERGSRRWTREERRQYWEEKRRERKERREQRRQEAQAQGVAQPAAPQSQTMGPPTRGLTILGSKTTVYTDQYTPALLEAFENRHPENDFFVKFNCPEFTSLCPITGQPDFATLYISYIPDRKMVESKSLKLYLFSFRNHGAFHEDCVNIIMKDLIKLLSPRYIEVWGKFMPRGGLSIDPYANYGRPTTRWEEFARQRLLMHDLSPEKVDNR